MTMTYPPVSDPQKAREIDRLRKLLAQLQSIPAHRREDECADVREATLRMMLVELGAEDC